MNKKILLIFLFLIACSDGNNSETVDDNPPRELRAEVIVENNVLFEFKSLVPNWKLMEMLKSKQISEFDFEKEYLIQLNNLNAKTIFEQVNFLTGEYEPILMTHGNKSSFCHRHIVAKWFENALGVRIDEFKIGAVQRSNGYMKKITQKRLFENE